MLGAVPGHAGMQLHEGHDETGSSSDALEVSQEEARPEEATTEAEERASKSPYLDCQATLETSEENTLKGVADPPYK
jgi:hypothetical protein